MRTLGYQETRGFDEGFGPASPSERRQADLFYSDLVGIRRVPRRTPFRRGTTETWEAAGIEWDDLAEDTFTPEKLSPDMTGLEFVLVSDADIKTNSGSVRHKAGTVVTVVRWENGKQEIEAKIGSSNATIAKELLAPKVTMYKSTVNTAKGQREIAIPLYVTDARSLRAAIVKGKAAGADQTRNYKQLNKHLIIEMMLNRLDKYIGAWTTSYDAIIGEPNGWPPLAPGWVKSMMVQESTAGTAGVYLVEVPGTPMKTRFNVLQAIDSWGPQQFLMMQEIEPDLLKKKGLDKVMDDQRALEKEWKVLDGKTSRTAAERDRLTYLDELKFAEPVARRSPTWSTFFFRYPDVRLKAGTAASRGTSTSSTSTTAPPTTSTGTSTTSTGATASKPFKYWDVVVEFLEAGTPKRKYDYSFWIRAGVRWLFEKRKEASTWSDAVRAYNGAGGRAEFYRAIVLTRARAAAAAAGIKEEIWGGFNCPPDSKTTDGLFQLCPFERIANACEPRC